MRRIAVLIAVWVVCMAHAAYADSVSGRLENVDLKKHEITVKGVTVKVDNQTMISCENKDAQDRDMTLVGLVPYRGSKATCRYFERKAGLVADKIRVYEGR